jgi:inhibitor of KinA
VDVTVKQHPRVVEIPVCYGGEFGPDLGYVAEHNQLSVEEVIEIHTSGQYLVYMIGFAPGFPYLGGMSERIMAPRRQSPRLAIPAGTVGIAGMQTGVYPIETPGGWQLIGRTPLALFRPQDNPPSLLQSGDIVRFCQISDKEYEEYKEEDQ